MAKLLLLGGTGAMGVYLAPLLMKQGHEVFVTSRSPRESGHGAPMHIKGNAQDAAFVESVLEDNNYDAVVDFMTYGTEQFQQRRELLLEHTGHYIFLSSYRVYAESALPLTEESSRLLDVSNDAKFLKTDEYSLKKARQENLLLASQHKNWTIIRPAITYSKTRFQLGTLEANTILNRAQCKCPVILPAEMLEKYTTMTWAGDVAKMIAGLVLNKGAISEIFNVSTNENRKWKEIAQSYNELTGLTVIPVDLEAYCKAMGGEYQVKYDRMYHRTVDNTKILKATGLRQQELVSVHDGLKIELADWQSKAVKVNYALNARLDRITHTHIPLQNVDPKEKLIYAVNHSAALSSVYRWLSQTVQRSKR